nr:DNA-binding protein [Aerococcus urinae]
MKLLTEPEVAERLRCSREKVKRLRLSGKLAYIPGRPLLVDEVDLAAYLASIRRQVLSPAEKTEEKRQKEIADAARWAREAVLLRRPRRNAKSTTGTGRAPE